MFDFAIVGGGIVGLSTARALLERHPNAGVLVLEKEEGWARHQTGHNSGVIHSGVYYKPGSLKARFSRDGVAALLEFCREQRIAYEICGKVIVATDPDELPRLDDLYERGLKNGLKVEKIRPDELEELEPHAAGLAALKVPETGIVDFTQVAEAFATVVEEKGGELRKSTEVEDVSETEDEVEISTSRGTFRARSLVNCAGLHSDRVALLCGVEAGVKIVPFRGEYYELKPEKRHLVKNIVYPLPDPSFPFLNVHLTRTVEGGVEAGPNAVLGLAREGYRKTDINIKDSFEALTYPGLWRLARTYWRTGIGELVRSFSRKVFTRSLKKLIPEVEEEDLAPIEAGVRAQALAKDGVLVNDFLIVDGKRSVHVLNAPSPAATAAIPIGKTIAERITERRRP